MTHREPHPASRPARLVLWFTVLAAAATLALSGLGPSPLSNRVRSEGGNDDAARPTATSSTLVVGGEQPLTSDPDPESIEAGPAVAVGGGATGSSETATGGTADGADGTAGDASAVANGTSTTRHAAGPGEDRPAGTGRGVTTIAGSTPSPSTTIAAGSTTGRPPPTAGRPEVDSDWAPLTLAMVDPRDFGAAGNGVADDTDAVQRAIDSLDDADGGIVFFADGKTYRTTEPIRITGDHVKLWARSGRGAMVADTNGARRSQAIICLDTTGCGIHGLRLRSDSTRRLTALEDSRIAFDGAVSSEVVGVEIDGSASAAVFFYGRSRDTYVEGNYFHHNWADSVHFTNGARRAWVWGNTIFNQSPTKGDDGVACVSYENEPLCGEMEWWHNTHLGTDWGRGFAVVGGEHITIHDNFARGIAGAGILVASEPSYNTPGSNDIDIYDNVLYETGQVVPHSGILISGLSDLVSDVSVRDNLVVASANDEAFRTEGDTARVSVSNLSEADRLLPQPLPSIADGAEAIATNVLKLRDPALVAPAGRRGLYRVHVRQAVGGGFEQRLEYVVAGSTAVIDGLLAGQPGSALAFRSGTPTRTVAVLLSPEPLAVPSTLDPVGFEELRAGAAGSLAALWNHLDS